MNQAFRKETVVRGALLMTGSTYITYAFGLVVSALIARAIGPEAFGTYSYVVWLSGLLVMVANNGLTTTGIRFVSESLGRGDVAAANDVHGWLARRQMLCALVVVVGFLCSLAWFKPAAWGSRSLALFAAIVLVGALGKMFYIFSISMAKGRSRFDIEAYSTIAATTLNIIAVAAMVALEAPLVAYLVLFATMGVVHVAIARFQLARAGISSSHGELDPALRVRLRRHLAWTVVLTIVYAVSNKSIETWMLNRMVGPEEVGFFVIAASLTRGGVELLSSGLTSVLMPVMAHGFGSGGQDRVNAILNTSLRYFAFLGLLLAGCGALFAELVIDTMYGAQYDPVVNVFRAMAAIGGLTVTEGAYGAVLSTTDNQPLRAGFAIGAVSINLVAAIVLIPQHGLWGAVGAHALSVAITFVLVAAATSRLLSARPPLREILRLLAAAAVAAVPALAIVHWFPGAIGGAVAGIAYAATLAVASVLLRVWKRSDAATLQVLSSRLPAFLSTPMATAERWLARHASDA